MRSSTFRAAVIENESHEVNLLTNQNEEFNSINKNYWAAVCSFLIKKAVDLNRTGRHIVHLGKHTDTVR